MKPTTPDSSAYKLLAIVYTRYNTGVHARWIPNRSYEEKPLAADGEPERTAVIYTRVASARQHSESSDSATSRQVRACTSAAEICGLQVTDTFSDVGASGNATERPGLRKLLQHITSSPTDYVIVADHARLGRSLSTFQTLMARIEETGTRLLVANEVDAPKTADLHNEYAAKRKEIAHATNPSHPTPTKHSET